MTPARPSFLYMALACALVAFAGFAPTYFLRGLSDLPPLSVRTHVHGAIFTAWMLLFIAQAALVRADRRDLHRILGMVGAVLAVAMIWVATTATIDVMARFEATGLRPHGLVPVEFLGSQLGALLQFATLVALGVALRRRADVHKRLMVLATITILPPAVARFHLENHGLGAPAYANTLLAYSLILLAAAFDFARMRRVHPVYIWGGLAMLAWMFTRAALSKSDWWQPIGRWLIASGSLPS